MVIFFQQNNLNNCSNIFVRNIKLKIFGFILSASLSLLIMIADYYCNYLHFMRNGFALIISPLQFAVDYPARIMEWFQSIISTKKALIKENMQLRHQQILLEAELQKLLIIKKENSQLRGLLQVSGAANMRAMVAQILAVDTSSSRQIVVLNKGKHDGVYIGQPVLDAKGVIGQVMNSGLLTSTVLLISDAKNAVPVINNRTGERSILVGTNDISQLSLINLPRTSSIKVNDLLITSGLGGVYPAGYPVGRVCAVQDISGEDLIRVDVRPIALLNQNRLVLLIWPEIQQNKLI